MTKQKAIEILGQYDVSDLHFYTTDGEEIPFTEWSDAIEMAISALREQDPRRICDTCKHNPPSKKYPCVDCDMREPADRWEKQDPPDTDVGDMVSRQASCVYCHEDFDGYVKPIEKNSHAFIRFGMDGWELDLSAKGWHGAAEINFCPMCGRELKT